MDNATRNQIARPLMGLDVSLVGTGIVVLSVDGVVLHSGLAGGVLKNQNEPGLTVRLVAIASIVYDVVAKWGVGVVGVEGYAFAARGNSHTKLAEARGAIKLLLYLNAGLTTVPVPCKTARKSVLGRGNIDPDDVIRELGSLGVNFTDHNIADAYVVAEHIRRLHHGSSKR
jgi:Holliday junction resolvasome RuvABC endonuclease subunit